MLIVEARKPKKMGIKIYKYKSFGAKTRTEEK